MTWTAGRRQLPRGLRGRSQPGRPVRPASCRSRTSSTAPSARTTTCCSSTTRDRRRGRRPGPAVPRGAARPAPRRHRAGLLTHPGAGPGRGLPADAAVAAADDLQHGRRRQIHRRAGRTGAAAVLSPRAAALFGLEILADEIQDLAGQPDAVPHPCAARRADAARAVGGGSRRGRRSSWRCATSRAPCSRCSRCSPSTA